MRDGMEGCGTIIAYAIYTVVFVTIGFLAGYSFGTFKEQQGAIKANVGKWVVDEKTGEKEFKYGVNP